MTLNCPVKFSGTYYVVQNGPVYFLGGATLRFTDEVVSFAYPIVVRSGATLIHGASIADSSTLTLEAGATIKPAPRRSA